MDLLGVNLGRFADAHIRYMEQHDPMTGKPYPEWFPPPCPENSSEGARIAWLADTMLKQMGALQVRDSETAYVDMGDGTWPIGSPKKYEHVEFQVGRAPGEESSWSTGADLFCRILCYIGVQSSGAQNPGQRLHWSWRVRPEVDNRRAYARLCVFWHTPKKAAPPNALGDWQWIRRKQMHGSPGGWEIARVDLRKDYARKMGSTVHAAELQYTVEGDHVIFDEHIAAFGPRLEPPAP